MHLADKIQIHKFQQVCTSDKLVVQYFTNALSLTWFVYSFYCNGYIKLMYKYETTELHTSWVKLKLKLKNTQFDTSRYIV